MLIVVSAKVCLLLVFWMLVYAIFCTIVSQPMTRLNKTYSDNYHDIFAKVSDSVSNIFTVKAFSRENYEAGKLKSFLSLTFIPSLLKAYWFEFKVNVVHAFIYWGMLISTFLMMVYLRMHQAISNGDMAYIMGLTLAISSRIDSARRSVEQLFREIGDFKSAFSILSLPQISDAHLPDLTIMRPSIKIKNMVFKYPENPRIIFNRLNLTIKPGEKVGVVGRSGAGKSSLVALINKHFEPLDGAIYIDNQELSTVNSASVRRSIAVIPQDCMLFHRSVMENIRYGRLEASDEEVFEAARQANLHEFITSLSKGYDTEVGERGVKLSGGQKQRIAIARAILKRAPILILDEATASLDTETEKLIQASLETFFANQTTTIIAIAHRLSTLKNMDRILVMDQGVIVEQGTHVELLNKPDSVYRKLWELQQI